jgi:hypothetical protein
MKDPSTRIRVFSRFKTLQPGCKIWWSEFYDIRKEIKKDERPVKRTTRKITETQTASGSSGKCNQSKELKEMLGNRVSTRPKRKIRPQNINQIIDQ